jgi:hypothetical protein
VGFGRDETLYRNLNLRFKQSKGETNMPALKPFSFFRRVLMALLVLLPTFSGEIPVQAMEGHSPAFAGEIWYVSPSGDDANSCTSAGSSCATITGAVFKSTAGDSIRVAAGTYGGWVTIEKSVQVTGGWNNTFTTQTGFSVIDGNYTEPTFVISTFPEFGQITVEISRFIIQHSSHQGINVANTILTLRDTTIRDNRNTGYGGGMLASVNNTITLNNVTITGNHSTWSGGAIYSYGYGQNNTITINNSTITNNSAGLSGGGLFIESGVIHLRNSILAGNSTAGQGADCLGTISSAQYTIVGDVTGCTIPTGTGNQLNIDPLIGDLPIGSPGYHALKPGSPAINAGNAATCLGADARGIARPQGGACDLGAYEYAAPGAASAFGIISGTPQETGPRTTFPSQFAVYVVDTVGNPVSGATVNFSAPNSGASGTFAGTGTRSASALTDQAGVALASSFTANSQQGTYNVTASVAGLSGSVSFALTNAAWYVALSGSDSNACNTSSSPCATINKAVEKASDGDTILVRADTYTPITDNDPVVWIYKDVTVSGGWNANFTAQDDYSVVDGENIRQGVQIGPSSLPAHLYNPVLDHFVIQNSRGGLYVSDSNLWLKDSFIVNNGHSGIYTFHSNLTITDSVILGNVVPGDYGNGGGINLTSSSSLMMKDSVVAENQAHVGGGISLEGGNSANLINVTLSGNVAWVAGGLFASQGYVNLNNITVTDNVATVTGFSDTGGGGIANSGDGSNFIVENSIIAGNVAVNGADCLNTFTSRGHNLIGTSKGCTFPAAAGDQIGPVNSLINPMLNELKDSGGPKFTLTHALQSNSPAIDAGNDSTCASNDQRGVERPQGTGCDIGAFEAEYTLVNVKIGSVDRGSYPLVLHGSRRQSFNAVNNGPIKVQHLENTPIIAAERVIYQVGGLQTSFTELMGLPDGQLDTTYWLPWYNNVNLDTQLRIANATDNPAAVTVTIGGVEMPSLNLAAGESTRVSYADVNDGPVKIESTQKLVAAERVIYKVGGVNTSFSEMMALPDSQLDTKYWLPWYNNVNLDTQLRIGNVSSSTATVHVFIGGNEVTPVEGITLLEGESTRLSYPAVNDGPVQIVSYQNIVAAERVIYKVNNVQTSFSEMMGLPDNQLDTTYWLPWYNNVNLDTQLRIGNVSGSTATVHVFIGGEEVTALEGITLLEGASTRLSYAGVNDGPVQIVSDQDIVAAERVIYKVNNVQTSFTEMMALPASQLDSTYWFPWYNNLGLDTQLRFGVP